MQKNSAVQQGWAFATEILGADVAANMGASYVDAIEQAIKQLEDNINNHQYRNLGIGQLQGYVLEEWGSGTFNVDAAAADSADRAAVLHSTAKDSVDIQLDSGKAYSAKSYVTAEKQLRLKHVLRRKQEIPAIKDKDGLFPPINLQTPEPQHIEKL